MSKAMVFRHCGVFLYANVLIEWTSVPAATSMREIVCRTSNRVFVGLPLCTSAAVLDDNLSSFVS